MIHPRLRQEIEDSKVRLSFDAVESELLKLQQSNKHLSKKLDRAYGILLFFSAVNLLLISAIVYRWSWLL